MKNAKNLILILVSLSSFKLMAKVEVACQGFVQRLKHVRNMTVLFQQISLKD